MTDVTGVTGVTVIPSGARVLDDVQRFLETFVAYPNDWASAAHTLWICHAHAVECFENTPRLAFLSPEPGSGKSRAMEITEALVPNPLMSVNASTSAIFRSISDENPPTLLMDEVDAIFTGKGDTSEDLRGLLNSGYRRGAFALRSAIKGKEVITEKWPTFCATALAGLNTLPDTLMTRAIVIRMKRRRRDQHVQPFRRRTCGPDADLLREAVAGFIASVKTDLADAWPELPAGIEDRDADVWEALLAVADAAGGRWPALARRAASAAVAEAHEKPLSLGIQLLTDIRTVFGADERLSSADLLDRLRALDTAPWSSIKGEPIDARFLARMLDRYDIHPAAVRIGGAVVKGYQAVHFTDAWDRYCNPPERSAHGGSDFYEVAMNDDVVGDSDDAHAPSNNGYSGYSGYSGYDAPAAPVIPIWRAERDADTPARSK